MNLEESIEKIDKTELINKVISSWFPELKKTKISSDLDAIEKYRIELRKFSNQKAIDKVTKKLILLDKFILQIGEYTDEFKGIHLHNNLYFINLSSEIEISRNFVLLLLEKEIAILERELIRPLKIKWIGSSGQLGEVFHKLYDNGFIDSSKTNLINWIQEAIDHNGKRVTINDVIMGGEANYKKQIVIDKINRKN
jgi:hypothetical protein